MGEIIHLNTGCHLAPGVLYLSHIRSFKCKETAKIFMKKEKIPSIPPGEILFEEFLKPMGLSQNRLAVDIKVPPRRINEIILGKRKIAPDTALRLSKYFKMSPEFWLGLQMDYELDIATDRLYDRISQEVGEYEATINLD